jgi:hypothetical protein
VAGHVDADVLDDAGDVQAIGVVEMLQGPAGDERLGQRQAVGAELREALRDHERQRIAGVGDPVDLQALADVHVGGGIETDENAAGRVLDVDRPPDRVGEGDGRGDGDGEVQGHLIGPQRADGADGLEQLEGVRVRGRILRLRRDARGEEGQANGQDTERQSMWGSRHDDWVFNRQRSPVV